MIICLLKRVMSQEERKGKAKNPLSCSHRVPCLNFTHRPRCFTLHCVLCTTALRSRGNLQQSSKADSSYKTHSGKAHSSCKLLRNMDQSNSTSRPSHMFSEQTSTVLEEKKSTMTILQLKEHLCHLIHAWKQQQHKFLILHILPFEHMSIYQIKLLLYHLYHEVQMFRLTSYNLKKSSVSIEISKTFSTTVLKFRINLQYRCMVVVHS